MYVGRTLGDRPDRGPVGPCPSPDRAADTRPLMLFPTPADAAFAATISNLAYCNPFLPERIEHERQALGLEFVEADVVWNVTQDWEGNRPNIAKLQHLTEQVAGRAREALTNGVKPSPLELRHYEDLIDYLLYYRVQEPFQRAIK